MQKTRNVMNHSFFFSFCEEHREEKLINLLRRCIAGRTTSADSLREYHSSYNDVRLAKTHSIHPGINLRRLRFRGAKVAQDTPRLGAALIFVCPSTARFAVVVAAAACTRLGWILER